MEEELGWVRFPAWQESWGAREAGQVISEEAGYGVALGQEHFPSLQLSQCVTEGNMIPRLSR